MNYFETSRLTTRTITFRFGRLTKRITSRLTPRTITCRLHGVQLRVYTQHM
jgi:hypothetical protein